MTRQAKGIKFYDGQRTKVRLQWEPKDLWVGVFWRVSTPFGQEVWEMLHVYVTVVPMLPLHITHVRRKKKNDKDHVQGCWVRSPDSVSGNHGVS